MYNRIYKKKEYGNHSDLLVIFQNLDFEILTNFTGEIEVFSKEIRQVLEATLSNVDSIGEFSGNMLGFEANSDITEIYYNYAEEELGGPVFLPTTEFKRFVDEYCVMKEKFDKGELDGYLPITIDY